MSPSRKARSWAVTVVPTLAPKMTAMADGRSMRSALTNPTAITVTAEELCKSPVAAAPARAPVRGLLAQAARDRLTS